MTLRTRGGTGDRSYTEGERVAGDLIVKRIERDQIAFEYDGETIWVHPTP